MTAVTADRPPRRSLLGAIIGALNTRSRARYGRPSKLAAAVQEHVMTFAALATADVGGFLTLHRGGWFVLAASVFLADFKIQG